MSCQAKSKSMTEGPLAKQILFVSLPLALSNLLQILFNMSDVAVVGRFAGSTALGAVGSTSTFVTLFTGFLIGLSNGINVLVARFYAAFRSSAIVSGAMGGLRPAVIGMIGAAVVSVGQTVFLQEGLAAVTAYPLVCSLAIFALMAVLTHKKLHPIVIILLSALLGIVTGYLQPA